MRYKKGQSGNLKGRPKGSKTKFSLAELKQAIGEVEKKQRLCFFEHVVIRAYKSDRVLVSLLRKLIPDAQDEKSSFDEDWINEELEFSGVPKAGKGNDKFKKFYS